jgi:hypothetical protein
MEDTMINCNLLQNHLSAKACFARQQEYATKSKMKIERYDLRVLSSTLIQGAFRDSQEYAFVKDWLIETTMSCDRDEAKNWMKFYMADALECSNGEKNDMLRAEFLAAYDILHNLE